MDEICLFKGVSFPALSSYLRPASAKMEKQDVEKEVTDQVDTVDMEEEKKDMEKVVLKVNYETEDEKKEPEPATEPKPEPSDAGAAAVGHICSPSIESCPSPLTETVVSEERETEDAESGSSSMSTLSLPSRSASYHHCIVSSDMSMILGKFPSWTPRFREGYHSKKPPYGHSIFV